MSETPGCAPASHSCDWSHASRCRPWRIIASRPDTILLTPAFGLQNTRSPRAVQARADYSRLNAKRNAGAELSVQETETLQQLKLFVTDEE